MKRNIIKIVILILIMASCGAFCRALYNIDKTLIIGSVPDSDTAITAFFEEMSAKNYELAAEYIENYDSLGFETPSADSSIELYKQKLAESYSVQLVGNSKSDGLYAYRTVDITFLDSRKLIEDVSAKVSENALEYMYDGNVIESDEQAKAIFYDALEECLESPEIYYTTEAAELKLVYRSRGWQITVDDSLLNILFGYIDSLTTEGIN